MRACFSISVWSCDPLEWPVTDAFLPSNVMRVGAYCETGIWAEWLKAALSASLSEAIVDEDCVMTEEEEEGQLDDVDDESDGKLVIVGAELECECIGDW